MSHPPVSLTGLTASILARTSGPACGRLRGLACDLIDGTLPDDDLDLVRGHLDHCSACQALVSRIGEAGLILPGFAGLDPGAGFTASVLSQTGLIHPAPIQPEDRFVAGWARLMRRPRAVLEAAYLATAAGLILTQVPLPGHLRPASAAFVSRVSTGFRATRAGASSRAQIWTTRARAANPVRIVPCRDTARPTLWSCLTQRISHAWLDLTKAAREVRARIWRERPPSIPPPTELSDASPRPAP